MSNSADPDQLASSEGKYHYFSVAPKKSLIWSYEYVNESQYLVKIWYLPEQYNTLLNDDIS